MAKFCKLKSSTLTDYYKNHLSGYSKWEQSEHADEYLCFPANLGEHLSIDETSLSNGELYTIVTNKAGHGRKGSLVAMVKGTDSNEVCGRLLHKLPAGKRHKVKTITLDMSGSMSLIARKCFPLAKQIIDRFHVQKEFKEALQDLRIQYRWQAMEDENQEIAKCKKENTEYKATVFANGDTRKQLLARSRYLLFKNPDEWSASQKQRAEILFKEYDDIKQFYDLSLRLGNIYSTHCNKTVARKKMALWFNDVEDLEYTQFNTVVRTFSNHHERILNFFDERLTNANAESFNAKIKKLRANFRGVTDVKFFLFRVAKLFA